MLDPWQASPVLLRPRRHVIVSADSPATSDAALSPSLLKSLPGTAVLLNERGSPALPLPLRVSRSRICGEQSLHQAAPADLCGSAVSQKTRRALLEALDAVALVPQAEVEMSMPSSSRWLKAAPKELTEAQMMELQLQDLKAAGDCARHGKFQAEADYVASSSSSSCPSSPAPARWMSHMSMRMSQSHESLYDSSPLLQRVRRAAMGLVTPEHEKGVPAAPQVGLPITRIPCSWASSGGLDESPRKPGDSSTLSKQGFSHSSCLGASSPTRSDIEAALELMPTPPRSSAGSPCLPVVASPAASTLVEAASPRSPLTCPRTVLQTEASPVTVPKAMRAIKTAWAPLGPKVIPLTPATELWDEPQSAASSRWAGFSDELQGKLAWEEKRPSCTTFWSIATPSAENSGLHVDEELPSTPASRRGWQHLTVPAGGAALQAQTPAAVGACRRPLALARDEFKRSIGALARSAEFRAARLRDLDAVLSSPGPRQA